MPSIYVASSNAGKIAEFRLGVSLWMGHWNKQGIERAAQAAPWTLESLPDFGRLPACAEDALTFAGNAEKKALHYSRLAGGTALAPVLADDSGLEVDALGGAPGIHSRRFAGPAATDAENNAKLLRQMRGIPRPKRTARFVCELAVARDGRLLAQFRGVAEGLLLEAPRGAGGFGYDPLFLDVESDRTFAEFSPQEKLRRSHRGRALRAMLDWLLTHASPFPG